MKIRNGFVSNSSSASFICEICGEYWSEDRSPTLRAGICYDCRDAKKIDICNKCGKTEHWHNMITSFGRIDLEDIPRFEETARKIREELTEIDDDGSSYYLGGDLEFHTDHICLECFAKELDSLRDPAPVILDRWTTSESYACWLKKLSSPDYEPTETDQIIIKLLMGHEKR